MVPPSFASKATPSADASRSSEDERLADLYEALRLRLLDLSNRNPMLHARIAPERRSRRLVQIVDVGLETVYRALCGDDPQSLDLVALAEPDDGAADETGEAFLSSLGHAKLTDADYLETVARLEAEDADNSAALAEAEEKLRLKLRQHLELPERAPRHAIDRAAHARTLGIDPEADLSPGAPQVSAAKSHLQTLRFADDLDQTLDRMADAARLAVQETGLSTLYLIIGFLDRPDAEAAGKTLRAPLLLVPVRFVTRKVDGRSIVGIAANGGAETNLSLIRLVERDQRRQLPDFQPEPPETMEAPGGSVIGDYFAAVERSIDGLKGWRVRPWLVLGSLTFGRHQIYHDLDATGWPQSPIDHPLVRSILAGTDRPGDARDFAAAPDYDIDAAEFDRVVPNLIADTDSSQHQALIDVALGQNLVIEGPPGTGKSQTITNMIAHAIGQGKKVLFLSEKRAALDVVRRRLVAAGLGPFCLELHSDAAVPKTVVEALKARVDLGWGRPRSAARPVDAGLIEARQTVTRYLEGLHALQDDGETPYRLMWRAVRGAHGQEAAAAALRPLIPSVDRPSSDGIEVPHALSALGDSIEVYALAAAQFEARHGPIGASPWSRTGLADIAAYDFLRLRAALTLWREPMLEAVALAREGGEFGIGTLEDLARLAAIEADLGPVAGADHLELLADRDLVAIGPALDQFAAIAAMEAQMAVMPDLLASSRMTTAEAAELAASRFGAAIADRVPLDLNRAIRARVEEANDLIVALSGLIPALGTLGLARDRPGEDFRTLALLCRALASMTVARRSALLAYRSIGLDDVIEAQRRHADLVEAAADWRRHFPALDLLDLPASRDVASTGRWLRRGGAGRLLAGLSAEARVARAVMRALLGEAAGAGRAMPNPALFDQLADFIVYCEAFRDDPALRRGFGAAWQGLATPFEAIAASIGLRRAFRQALLRASEPVTPVEQTEGHRRSADHAAIVDIALDLDDGALAVLIGLSDPAERFLSLPQAAQSRLKGATLGAAIPQLEAEVRAAVALERLAGDPGLARLDRPIGVIATFHGLRETARAARQALGALPEAEAVGDLIGDGDPRAMVAARDWIVKVRASGLGAAAVAALIGGNAVEARARLGRIATEARQTLQRLQAIGTDTEAAFGWFNLEAGDPAGLLARIDALIGHHDQLGDFLAVRRLKLDLAAQGLGPFLDTAERLLLPMQTLPQMFATLTARARAEEARRAPALMPMSGIELDVRRKVFADRDRQRLAHDRDMLRARLTELPELRPVPGNNLGPKSTWTELALLHNEIAKSGRHLAIRPLLARAGNAVQALMPCFMVSPQSLAKFLAPGKLTFDLLVIDEASQMRPEDALGGLLRARQVVVVGDPKQLPPTDFFRRIEPEPTDDSDDPADADSILDICARSFSTVRRLKWHYRSRCESLIAFSNREFYRDSLITFPTNRPGGFSIDLIRVDGVYRNRRNPDEAARVAEEAVRFMRHFAESDDCPTLGIATMNIEQRDLIREELRRISAGDALVEAYQSRAQVLAEPVFVKNLENLQGDERDYMLISLVRGPAPGASRITQSFGPIGGRHGARRLNVLVTRARQRIGLFTSFGAEDIRPIETSPPGVHALQRYLGYVEAGGRAPATSTAEEPDSDFEQEVADRLRAAGFEVELQVGVSHYRIDLGVRHPDRPGAFLAGIECDGARYHSAKSARDRDRLREEILRGLGWDLIRVWSTDWFADPDAETRRLVRRLDLLRVIPDRVAAAYRFGLVEALERAPPVPAGAVDGSADGVGAAASAGSAQLTLNLSDPEKPIENPRVSATVDVEPGPIEVNLDMGLGARSGHSDDTGILSGFEEAGAVYWAEPDAQPQLELPALPQQESWSLDRLKQALIDFRDSEIAPHWQGEDRQRSILRSSMIDTFVNEHIVEPGQWAQKVERYQRLGTNAAELRFLDRICALVAKLS